MRAWHLTALACTLLWCASAAAHPPYGLVADSGGNLYFSDLRTVWRLGPDRRLELFRPPPADGHVHELFLAPDGAIEGDENGYRPAGEKHFTAIWRRTPAGREEWVVPLTTEPPFGMGLPQDGAGRRYSAQWVSNDDRRLLLLRHSPIRVEVLLGKEALPAFRQRSLASVGGMAFAPDGALVFADGPRLRRLAPDGRVSTLLDAGLSSSLRGVAAADGRFYAADMGRKRVLAVTGEGAAHTVWRSAARWMPTAVARAGDALFVLEAEDDPEHRSNRVRLVEVRGGKGAVVAEPWKAESPPAPPPPAADRHGFAPARAAGAAGAVAAAGVALWLALRRRAA